MYLAPSISFRLAIQAWRDAGPRPHELITSEKSAAARQSKTRLFIERLMPPNEVSDGSQSPMTFDLSLRETAGSRSLDHLMCARRGRELTGCKSPVQEHRCPAGRHGRQDGASPGPKQLRNREVGGEPPPSEAGAWEPGTEPGECPRASVVERGGPPSTVPGSSSIASRVRSHGRVAGLQSFSPSPLSSPLGRGNRHRRLAPIRRRVPWSPLSGHSRHGTKDNPEASVRHLTGERFSLSPRERAGVRGNQAGAAYIGCNE